jgi:hypothetical protein
MMLVAGVLLLVIAAVLAVSAFEPVDAEEDDD